jgi:hypothetical protein
MKLSKRELEIFNFSSKDTTRATFSSVYVSPVELIATDGHIMAVLQIEQPDPAWEPVLLCRYWVKGLCAKTKDYVELFRLPDGRVSTNIESYPRTSPIKGSYAPVAHGVYTVLNQNPIPNHSHLDTIQLHKVMSYVKKFKNRFTKVEPIGQGILFASGNLKILVTGRPERGSK